MRFAIGIPPFTDPSVIVGVAVDAEAAGWDGVLVWDHLQWDTHRGLEVHDPWAVLAAMAVRTERVMLGTAVTPLARRRPWVVAKQVTTLDHLSGGRAVLGVGLGVPSDADFGAFGDEPNEKARAGILDDGLALLDGLLRGEAVNHHGPHFNVEAQLRPPPVQLPRPRIFVAGVYPHRKPVARPCSGTGSSRSPTRTSWFPSRSQPISRGCSAPVTGICMPRWRPDIASRPSMQPASRGSSMGCGPRATGCATYNTGPGPARPLRSGSGEAGRWTNRQSPPAEMG